jgi:c-di-GMP-binding flagellar brake protein YcgR
MAETKTNRRRSTRVSANLNLEVKVALADGSETTANLETINISSSGVYFKSDHFIEPMTKLGMELEVCVPDTEGDCSGSELVPCEGLVVRINPEAKTDGCSEYEIAVFFTHIEPEGMISLERHISLLIDNFE